MLAIALVDVDLDAVVDHRIDPHRSEAGVAARVRIERRDAHQPVDARLGLQPAVGVVALDHDRRRLDAGLVAGGLFEHFDVEFAPLAPAHVHAQQHARPVAALGAAGAGMHLDIGIQAVGLARQQRLELAALAFRLQRPELRQALVLGVGIALLLAELDQRRRVVEFALDLGERPPSRSCSIVRSRITCCAASGLVQSSGSSDLAFSSARRRVAVSTSKMPPQQSQGLLDRLDQLFGFGAHRQGILDWRREPSGPAPRCKRAPQRARRALVHRSACHRAVNLLSI